MQYTKEVEDMVCVAKGPDHGPAPIPEEGKWVQAKEIKDISGYTHGIGWCAPQQGACKLSLNVKNGVIEEALVETIGCSGMSSFYRSCTAARSPRSQTTGFAWVRDLRTSARDCVPWSAPCTAPAPRAHVIWR